MEIRCKREDSIELAKLNLQGQLTRHPVLRMKMSVNLRRRSMPGRQEEIHDHLVQDVGQEVGTDVLLRGVIEEHRTGIAATEHLHQDAGRHRGIWILEDMPILILVIVDRRPCIQESEEEARIGLVIEDDLRTDRGIEAGVVVAQDVILGDQSEEGLSAVGHRSQVKVEDRGEVRHQSHRIQMRKRVSMPRSRLLNLSQRIHLRARRRRK